MNPKNTENEWVKDFNDFVNTNGEAVPKEVTQNIFNFVQTSLNPPAWLVFSKLLSIHFFVGTLSLAVCEQFGMSPFNTNFSLADYLMKFGHSVCMTLCGFLFIGLTVFFAWFLLKSEEFLVLTRNAFVQVFTLSVFSIVIFLALGAQIAVQIALLWLLGALLGGLTPIFADKYFRKAQSLG